MHSKTREREREKTHFASCLMAIFGTFYGFLLLIMSHLSEAAAKSLFFFHHLSQMILFFFPEIKMTF